ncbi:putative porin [Duganella sp. 1224]|uniref:porin n=1 Tax=Duganella sp. 1224 TaxID=2587052 RepID=UPI0015CC9DF8|nr:porin [Duganella sp. 1224]NYE59449.1 putative porin [Duganella sp. 1224]
MRDACLFAVLLASGGACQAQTNTTLYGIADLGLRSSSGLTANNAPAPGPVSAVSSGVNRTSRWGIRGEEDLGGGWQTEFRLEGGLNLDTGATAKSDKLFDRQAWVGVKTPYGAVYLGRQANLLSDVLSPVDPLQLRYASFNPNINVNGLSNTAFGQHGFGQQYGTSGYADNFYRLDNTVKYVATVGPVVARAAYSFGETTNGLSPLSTEGAGLTYREGGLVLSGAAMRFHNRDNLSLDAATAGAAYQLGDWQFKGTLGYNHADVAGNKQLQQRVAAAGVGRQLASDLLLTTAYYHVRRVATGFRDDGFDRFFAFLEKALSPRTTAYLEFDNTVWRGDASAQPNASRGRALTLGLMQKF